MFPLSIKFTSTEAHEFDKMTLKKKFKAPYDGSSRNDVS